MAYPGEPQPMRCVHGPARPSLWRQTWKRSKAFSWTSTQQPALIRAFEGRLAGTQFNLRRGEPGDVIPEFVVAEGIDLVVMGTVARAGIAGMCRRPLEFENALICCGAASAEASERRSGTASSHHKQQQR
jgi:hypothetical protein